jgi:hypothetical protein
MVVDEEQPAAHAQQRDTTGHGGVPVQSRSRRSRARHEAARVAASLRSQP